MQKETIHTKQAPAAIGPYVQAVRVGELIYTAGQGGLDPATGEMVEGGVENQTRQTMQNLAAVLAAAGSNFNLVVKTNIFLRYIKDFSAVNEVYASYFEGQFPARSTVAVSALPMTALVEIEMVAMVAKTDTEEVERTLIAETEKPQEKKTPQKVSKSSKNKRKTKKSKSKKKKGKK